jgi:hypothetical protein
MKVTSLKRRLPRILGLATAALALAAIPAANASADILPIPTPVIVPAPIPAPSTSLGGVTSGTSGGSTTGMAGGGSSSPSGAVPDGATALTALGDPAALAALGDPSGSTGSQQGPNDNRGESQQAQEANRQQYVMTAQMNALNGSQDALDAAYAGGGSGQFAWPEQTHTITQGFGCTNVRQAPTSSQCPSGHFHTGLDIAGPNLVDVHAADTGVARIFYGTTGYGNYVIITHGNGYSTLYGHLHDLAVKDGQLVQRGDLIAHEGTTGNSTGPHVHFEIRQGGGYLDPCPFLDGCQGY